MKMLILRGSFILQLLLPSHSVVAEEDCFKAGQLNEFMGDMEAVITEVSPESSVKVDLLTKGAQSGLVSFEMTKDFAPPTQERFDQVVQSLSSEIALNKLDAILEHKRNPAVNIVIEAHSGAPAAADGKYRMETDTWIENFKGVTKKKSVMNCSQSNGKSKWVQSCEIDLTDSATTKYVRSGNRQMSCSLEAGKKLSCVTKFSAHPKDLDLPFVVRPIARKVAGTSDLSASQLAYKTVQRSLGLILALHEYAENGGAASNENLEKSANSARASVYHQDVDKFMKTLPTSPEIPVSPIHYYKKSKN